MSAFSYDSKEAFLNLNEEFALLVDSLLIEKDEDLTEDAIQLKNLVRQDLKSVEQ